MKTLVLRFTEYYLASQSKAIAENLIKNMPERGFNNLAKNTQNIFTQLAEQFKAFGTTLEKKAKEIETQIRGFDPDNFKNLKAALDKVSATLGMNYTYIDLSQEKTWAVGIGEDYSAAVFLDDPDKDVHLLYKRMKLEEQYGEVVSSAKQSDTIVAVRENHAKALDTLIKTATKTANRIEEIREADDEKLLRLWQEVREEANANFGVDRETNPLLHALLADAPQASQEETPDNVSHSLML